VIGGIGSIRGALVGSILVGCIDTLGRTGLQQVFREFLPPQWASAAGPATRVDRGLCVHGRGACVPSARPVPGAHLMATPRSDGADPPDLPSEHAGIPTEAGRSLDPQRISTARLPSRSPSPRWRCRSSSMRSAPATT
jgi:hypothetical protein